MQRLPSPSVAAPGAALTIDKLSVGYGNLPVLEQFSLHVPAGQALALIGPNGAGKSTLARAISGLLKVSSGDIQLDGASIVGRGASLIAASGVLHVAETRDIFGDMTVWENLMVAFDNLGREAGSRADALAKEQAAFERVYDLFPLLRERRNQLAGTMSGGEQQMLAMGRALMARPKMLLLDEPSMGLSPIMVDKIFEAGNLSGGQQQMLAIGRALLGRPRVLVLDEPSLGLARIVILEIYKTLDRLRQDGLTILLIEQAATTAIQFAETTAVLVGGKIVMQGSRAEMSNNADVIRHYLGSATPA